MKSTRSSHTSLYASGGFSSRSIGSYNTSKISANHMAPITPVTINESLLTPLNIDIDPAVQAVRTQEKEQIKSLNNRFASFIDKVRYLEQQNKMLDTKWKLLQQHTAGSSNIEPMLKSQIAHLERQLELLSKDKQRLEAEKAAVHDNVFEYKTKYEQEINKRNDTESEFVMIKKDVDSGYVSKVELDDKLCIIRDEFNFLIALHDAELRELKDSLKETSVVVQMDNSRGLNMDQILADVKAQYEDIASRSREETENWYKTKFDQITVDANQYSNKLQSTNSEIAELKRLISRLQQEINAAVAQRTSLEGNIAAVEEQGENAMQDAKDRIRDLDLALKRAKQDMAHQLREYQELMNVKLALDIEISTYRKLLEGEEERIGQASVLNVQTVFSKSALFDNNEQHKSSPVFIKTVETFDRTY